MMKACIRKVARFFCLKERDSSDNLHNFAPRMDDKHYLLSLIREGEHQQQDFKYRVADACKLAKTVSAFANTDGGRLLIGVRDDGHLSGVRSEEEIYMMQLTNTASPRRASSLIPIM